MVILTEFEIPSQPGNELKAIRGVEKAIQSLDLDQEQIERVKTAVGECTMNAMEHSNHFHPDLPVRICVLKTKNILLIQVIDAGDNVNFPESEPPDVNAKLAGMQSPRGWGLFLIKNMVDEVRIRTTGTGHIVELLVKLIVQEKD